MSKTTNKSSPEVRERAVRLVLDNQGQHESHWSANPSEISRQQRPSQTPTQLSKDQRWPRD